MILHLSEKLDSIYLLSSINEIIKESQGLTSTKIIENLASVRAVRDPVENFLIFYSEDSGFQLDSIRRNYIKNALYSAKGAPEIFSILGECLEISIEYSYEYPIIEILRFNVLNLSNPEIFISKFKDLIYSLLYYTELNLLVNSLILRIIGNLIGYNSQNAIGYSNINLETYVRNF